jgi:hypothetical protein
MELGTAHIHSTLHHITTNHLTPCTFPHQLNFTHRQLLLQVDHAAFLAYNMRKYISLKAVFRPFYPAATEEITMHISGLKEKEKDKDKDKDKERTSLSSANSRSSSKASLHNAGSYSSKADPLLSAPLQTPFQSMAMVHVFETQDLDLGACDCACRARACTRAKL